MNLKTLKLATCHYLDSLPNIGNFKGVAIRDTNIEKEILAITREMKIGAQFGGKYFCHDVRVIRLPRHGASLPISIGVSCGADRQVLGKINNTGLYLEKLEVNPAKYLPSITLNTPKEKKDIHINLNKPIKDIIKRFKFTELSPLVLLTNKVSISEIFNFALLISCRISDKIINPSPILPHFVKIILHDFFE